jgi:hypothetical protein
MGRMGEEGHTVQQEQLSQLWVDEAPQVEQAQSPFMMMVGGIRTCTSKSWSCLVVA